MAAKKKGAKRKNSRDGMMLVQTWVDKRTHNKLVIRAAAMKSSIAQEIRTMVEDFFCT